MRIRDQPDLMQFSSKAHVTLYPLSRSAVQALSSVRVLSSAPLPKNRKARGALRCIAVYLSIGVDLRLMEGDDF